MRGIAKQAEGKRGGGLLHAVSDGDEVRRRRRGAELKGITGEWSGDVFQKNGLGSRQQQHVPNLPQTAPLFTNFNSFGKYKKIGTRYNRSDATVY